MADELEPLPPAVTAHLDQSVDRILLTLLLGEFAQRLENPKEAQPFIDMLRFRVDEYGDTVYGKNSADTRFKDYLHQSADRILNSVKIATDQP